MPALPDANFWLALAWDGHRAHSVARTWWEAAEGEQIYFCRVTQMELLRHLTSRAVMGTAQKSQAEAWRAFDVLRASPRVEWLAEPPGLEGTWREVSSRGFPSHKRWTDDYLAAFAQRRSLRVVTFDTGFTTYPGLTLQLLVMPAPASAPTA
jgi:toxin-antitoxin system PIN domain toxin